MEVTLVVEKPQKLDVDAVVVFEYESEQNAGLGDAFTRFYESSEISGKAMEFTLLHSVAGFKASRVLVAGTGKKDSFDANVLRKLAGAAVRFLRGKGVQSVGMSLRAEETSADRVKAITEGVLAGVWEPDEFQTEKSKTKPIVSVTIAVATASPELEAAVEQGRILGEATNVARNIAVAPPNLLTPMAMAERARKVAGDNGLTFEILDQDRMKQLGMGALLGVAQGSVEPPALIVMQYKPEKAISDSHLGLVGKGVTFDTGGISIKPAEGMEKMKYDMAGGASVIAAMQAIAKLKPGVAVTGIIPAVENMPGGKAQRPGDIVKSLSGKTVEILNTDAEGRLILADAITYAKQLGCTHLVDAATLTGAIVVALGYTSSGVFTNNEDFAGRWMAAAKASGEKMWPMPLDDDYRDQLKTVYADIANIGGRWGGACTAAMFLKEFAGDTPWVHVDVAGTAWLDDAKPFMSKGPVGILVRSFATLAMEWR